MYSVGSQRNKRKARQPVNIHQNKWLKSYISTIEDSRRPLDSLSDMTNIELVQDGIVRPRPPLVKYGTQPTNTIIGRGAFNQNSERYLMWMQNVSGTGKLYKQKDGGAFTLIGGTYDDEAWAMSVQNKGRLYVYNAVDNLSYVDLDDDSIKVYVSLTTPSISSVTKTGMTGSNYTHYYRVTANNEVGESIASAVVSVDSGKIRDDWIENTDYTTVSWGTVTNATSYTVYYGSASTVQYELFTTEKLTFEDKGTLATNPYKEAPDSNSTVGPAFTYMYVDERSSQIFGITSDNKLYYSGPNSGSFAGVDGGGFVPIDESGSTKLNYVTGFRNGKGDPVITVSSRGAAGRGKIFHVSFETLTVGDTAYVYPNVYESNGQSGSYAPRGTIKARDSIFYPTGQDFKSTGTSQNIMNILTTNSISTAIEPDVNKISLSSLDKCVGLEYQDRLYWALAVGSTENNEIWYMDTARKNAWILRWPVSAKDMWLYEDNSGKTHFCILQDNIILEFTRAGAQTHQDNGTPFRSRAAFKAMVWDEDGLTLAKIRKLYAKLLYPKGTVTINTTGLTRKGVQQSTGSDSFTVTTTPTGYEDWIYDVYEYDADPGPVNTYGKSVAVLKVRPKGLLAELSWEVVADTAGSDYILSAVNSKGFRLEDLVLKT